MRAVPTQRTTGASPVIGMVLLVALVVLLAASITLIITERASRMSHGSSFVGVNGRISSDQSVRLTHISGRSLKVSRLRVIVTLPNGKSGTLTRLPVANVSHCFGSHNNAVDSSNIEGDDVFSEKCGDSAGSITLDVPDTDGVWSPGDFISFRITDGVGAGDDGMRIESGDVVDIRIVHDIYGVVSHKKLKKTPS